MGQTPKALLIDLEGTLYFKGEPIPGADAALKWLRAKGVILRFLTNTDSKSTITIQSDLAQMGLEIAQEEIFTPVTALKHWINQQRGKNFHLLLSEELKLEFPEHQNAETKVDYVVVGDFRESVSYATINDAFQLIMDGAEIVALQMGKYFIRSNGFNVDTGAFVHLLEFAAGKTACLLGKPSVEFFRLALSNLACQPNEVAVIGDDISTDIAGARRCGYCPILVRTGKFSEAVLHQSVEPPEIVIDSVADIERVWEEYCSAER